MERLRWSEVPQSRKWALFGFGLSFFFCSWLCIYFATKIEHAWADVFFGVVSGLFALPFALFMVAAVRALCLPRKQSAQGSPEGRASGITEAPDELTPVVFFMSRESRERTDEICRYFEAKNYVEVVNYGMGWTLACVEHVKAGGEVCFRYPDGSIKTVGEFAKSDSTLFQEEEDV